MNHNEHNKLQTSLITREIRSTTKQYVLSDVLFHTVELGQSSRGWEIFLFIKMLLLSDFLTVIDVKSVVKAELNTLVEKGVRPPLGTINQSINHHT